MTRSTCEILLDIFETVNEKRDCKKTQIIRFANLDWYMAEKYLSVLIEDGYIEKYESKNDKGDESYRVTKKGKEMIKALKFMESVCSKL